MTLRANFAPAAHDQADLAAKLGKPARLLVGLGSTDQSDITAQGITPDIFERYLVGSGQNLESGWQTWNSPVGPGAG